MITSTIVLLPLAGALALMLLPRDEEGLQRGFTFGVALLNFFISLGLLLGFMPTAWNGLIDVEWVAGLGIHWKLGVDGISLYLVLLTTFLMPVALLSTWKSIHKHVREFCIAMLILETGMVGTFLALDLFFFYVFWEVMLIPMYLIIGIWGGEARRYASIKFVLYTMVGSLLMLVAILYLYVQNHAATQIWTFDYLALTRLVLPAHAQLWCFSAFALAFLIKVPLFPLHTWLPDAHVEAPTAGSVLLAGVMLKFGTYGLIRFAWPLFPDAVAELSPYIAVLAVIGIVYGSLVAFAQKDMKKLIAYSSVAHMGFVVLGITVWNVRAVDGALYQMLAHGISTGGLFLCVGVLYDQRHTRRIDEYGGLAAIVPRFTAVFMILTLASVGLPGLSGFVGEFLVLIGTFSAWRPDAVADNMFVFLAHPKLLAVIATTGVIFSAVYMLYLFQKVMFGPVSNQRNRSLKDLDGRQLAVFAPMVLMAFWLGMYPSTFLRAIDPAVTNAVASFKQKSAEHVAPDGPPRALPMAPPPVAQPGAGSVR